MIKKIRLGDLLLENSMLTQAQLDSALAEQKRTGAKLGEVLVNLGYIDETSLLNLLSRQLNLPFVELKHYQIKPDVIRELPESFARKYRAIPIDKVRQGYLVAMADPTDLLAYDEISRKLKKNIRPCVVKSIDLLRVIDQVYRRTDEIATFVEELETEIGQLQSQITLQDDTDVTDAPVIKLLDSIFEDAAQVGASDIHIEPGPNLLRIRMRIDGVMQEQIMKGTTITSALVLRIKLMAKMNISEKRLPQDGRISLKLRNKNLDVRVSTMPIQDGESVVLRLLDQSKGILSLEQLGMPSHTLERLRYHLRRPHGIILVTGPTGSGKTTTLYACLSELNSPEKKIITVEDPVEYSIPRINQVHVKTSIGLTFASILRAALRQDPDIVMVGEIRDEETAGIAVRAAMTGHLVLSTVHTNDAISTPLRLIQMGIEPYLAGTALRLAIAQRLIRRVCGNCADVYTPTDKEIGWLKVLIGTDVRQLQFLQGKGCHSCAKTGYKGRIGVYELLEIDNEMADALRQKDWSLFVNVAKKNPGYRSLMHCALDYATQGLTTIQEVFRLANELVEDVPLVAANNRKQEEGIGKKPGSTDGEGMSLKDKI